MHKRTEKGADVAGGEGLVAPAGPTAAAPEVAASAFSSTAALSLVCVSSLQEAPDYAINIMKQSYSDQ